MLAIILTIFLPSFVMALSGALMPGPLLSVTISESSRRGVAAGPLMIVGHGILEMALVGALLSGLAPFLLRSDIFIAISLGGGAILLYMAYSMFRELPALCLHNGAEVEDRRRNLIVAGVVLSAANPYFLLWWATVGLGSVGYAAGFGLAGIAAFFLGHIAADVGWYSCVSYAVCKGRRFISDRGYRRLIGGCAVFLVAFAGYFFYSGLDRLFS